MAFTRSCGWMFIICCACLMAGTSSLKVYHLQPGDSERPSLKMDNITDDDILLETFTLCSWINIEAYIHYHTIIVDYNYPALRLILYCWDTPWDTHSCSFLFKLNNVTIDYDIDISLYNWYHICTSMEYSNSTEYKKMELYINGQHMEEKSVTGALRLNASLITINYNDPEANFYDSFYGKFTGFNLYDIALNENQIADLAQCNNILITPRLDWDEIQWVKSGVISESSENPCLINDSTYTLVMPILKTFNKSIDMCNKLGLSLDYPRNEEENREYIQMLRGAPDICSTPWDPSITWGRIGVTSNFTTDMFVSLNGNNLSYSNINEKPSKYDTTDIFMISTGVWDTAYSVMDFCPICTGKLKDTSLYFRGLCDKDQKSDNLYSTYRPFLDENGIIQLNNLNKWEHVIYYSNGSWHFHDKVNGTDIAWTQSSSFPLGVNKWTINSTVLRYLCKDNAKSYPSEKNLTLSFCDQAQFVCTDGECLDMNKRCNLKAECLDRSDEKDCEYFTPPENYLSNLPPELPLTMNINFHLSRIGGIEIKDEIVSLSFNLTLSWYDHYLEFKNLREDSEINILSEEESSKIWLPKIQFLNEERRGWDDEPKSTVRIERKTSSTRKGNDQIYKGEENPIIYELQYSKQMNCDFDMKLYPFDHQYCIIELDAVNIGFEKIKKRITITSEESSSLDSSEYYFIGMKHCNESNDILKIELHFDGSSLYHITATYLPTTLLHLLSFATLFISADNFSDRGNMSLTLLLVLIALYIQTLTELPRTPNLKTLDIWFGFSVAFVTLIILIHLTKWTKLDSFNAKWTTDRALKTARWVMALIYIAFLI